MTAPDPEAPDTRADSQTDPPPRDGKRWNRDARSRLATEIAGNGQRATP
ncbi:hypothetical protein ACU686_03720 [Yinghuangia aomiensis]